jgi:transposase
VKLLARGALRAGYTTDLWTVPRVTELIQQEFGVRYHPAHDGTSSSMTAQQYGAASVITW